MFITTLAILRIDAQVQGWWEEAGREVMGARLFATSALCLPRSCRPAEQFSLPQEQVLEELNGEGLGWVLPWGPLIPLSTSLVRWGSGPAGQHGTLSTAEHPDGQGEAGRVGRPGAPLQTALCSPDIGSSIGTAIHSQLKSTV